VEQVFIHKPVWNSWTLLGLSPTLINFYHL
jgi:hypothetical protein